MVKQLSETRKLRLLRLASKPVDHKKYYSQYCKLMREGLVYWQLGFASLTDKGKEYLRDAEQPK